jgi:hypothetical protein
VDFIQDIIFHFGVLNSIITDNGTQFTEEKFLDFCDDNNIHVDKTAVAHLCTNGQVERANGMILHGLSLASSPRRARMSALGSAPEQGSEQSRSPRYSGAYGQHLIGRWVSPHSSWCMGQRSCCPMTCSMGPLGSQPTSQTWSKRP